MTWGRACTITRHRDVVVIMCQDCGSWECTAGTVEDALRQYEEHRLDCF